MYGPKLTTVTCPAPSNNVARLIGDSTFDTAPSQRFHLTQSRPKILILDDEHSITDSLAAIFQIHGYTALRAYSGEMAVELARKFKPDFAILDIMMGGMSGVDAAILLRAVCPRCRTVMLTGAQDSAELLAAAARQGYDFRVLTKPIHPELLLREVAGPDGPLPPGLDDPPSS